LILRPIFRNYSDRTSLSIWAVAVFSWAILSAWTDSPYSLYLGHSALGGVVTVTGFLSLASIFLAGWVLMAFGMMLPMALPFVKQFLGRLASTQGHRKAVLKLLSGYVGIWAVFGIGAYLLDLGVHRISETTLLQGNTWVIGVSTVTLAGTYQFTSSKNGFLRECCNPGEFIESHWRDYGTELGVFRLGLSYGKATVGAHWALMLLMFALGMGNVFLMLTLGAIMAAEEQSKIAPRLRPLVGLALFAFALLLGLAALKVLAPV
jgi:predicted metal-binding membrane protein